MPLRQGMSPMKRNFRACPALSGHVVLWLCVMLFWRLRVNESFVASSNMRYMIRRKVYASCGPKCPEATKGTSGGKYLLRIKHGFWFQDANFGRIGYSVLVLSGLFYLSIPYFVLFFSRAGECSDVGTTGIGSRPGGKDVPFGLDSPPKKVGRPYRKNACRDTVESGWEKDRYAFFFTPAGSSCRLSSDPFRGHEFSLTVTT